MKTITSILVGLSVATVTSLSFTVEDAKSMEAIAKPTVPETTEEPVSVPEPSVILGLLVIGGAIGLRRRS